MKPNALTEVCASGCKGILAPVSTSHRCHSKKLNLNIYWALLTQLTTGTVHILNILFCLKNKTISPNCLFKKRYCTSSDPQSDKDCCLCLRKREQPCKDNGCSNSGGMCIDMKNVYLGENQFPRDVVDISKRLGHGNLCTNPNGPEKKKCCECYQRKSQGDFS